MSNGNGSKTRNKLTGETKFSRLPATEIKEAEFEREGMEDILKQSIEHFPALLDEAPICICNIDLKAKISYVNKRFEEVSGYSRDEVVGNNGLKLGFFSAATLKMLTKRLSERLLGKPPRLLELQLRRKDGRWIWIALEGQLIKKKSIPVGLQLVARDITERKQAEEALRVEKNKLQSIIDSIEYTIGIQDRDYNILYQSRPSLKDGVYHLGEKCYRVYEDRDEICPNCPVRKAFKDGRLHTNERRLVLPSGEQLAVEVTASPLKDDEGNVVSCLELMRDITERKQAEEALRAEKNKLQLIMNSIDSGISIHDRDYNIVYQSQPSTLDGGYHLGEKCYRAFEGRDEVCDDCPVEKAFKDGKPHSSERKLVTSSGEVRFLENIAHPLGDASGEISSCIEVTRDITESKEAGEALQIEKDKLQSVIDALEYGLSIQDRDYNIIYQNGKSMEVSGGNHVGEKCYRVFEGRDEVCEGCPVEKTFKDGNSHSSERRVVTSSGRVIYWENIASPVKDASGQVNSCLEIVKDITERKQMDGKLRESEERYRNLFESSHDMIQSVSPDGRFTFVNRAWLETMGYTEAELPELNLFEIIHPDSLPHCQETFAKIMAGEAVDSFQATLVAKDGRSVLVEGNGVGRYVDGKLYATQGIFRDITERTRIEKALHAAEEKYKNLMEATSDMVWEADKNGVYTFVGPRIRDLLGYEVDEVIGKKRTLDFVDKKELPKWLKGFKELTAKPAPFSGLEIPHLSKDGTPVIFEVSGIPILNEEGELEGFIGVNKDITERKQAEDMFRTLAVSSPIGVYIVQDGVFKFVSPRFRALLGYSEKELLDTDPLMLVHPEDREMVWRNAVNMLKKGRSAPYEYRYICKGGRTKWVMETVARIQYRGRRATLGNFLDVTERKQAEEELKLRAQMLDNATDSILVHDTDKNFIYVNEAACRIHGYSREEFMKMKANQIHDTVAGDDPAGVGQKLREKGEFAFEANHLAKDGSVIPMDVHCRLVESGGKELVMAVARDVTERKQAEEELRLRAQMLDGATDAIFIHGLEENFIYVNEAACRLLGYSREEFSQMKVGQLFPPQRVGTISSLRDDILGKGELVFESEHMRKDGIILPVEVHSRTIESGGQTLIIAVVRDITERRRVEEEKDDLERKAHLASRLASVGEMASGIAHEINNPLTAVIGFSQLLMDSELPDDTKEDIVIIHKEAQRAAGVARNLLTFARKHAPTKQPTDLNSIIEGVLKLRAYEQNVSNIQINTRLAPDLPEVLGDYSQLQQVFINLILNAEAAMLEANNGGTLTITTRKVNGVVRASFTDNGPGITKENLNRIFDPFFTTKEVGKGTGLGLSVCHGIINEHGGKIYARSKLGSGATFVVELPISS